ncbi:XdhC family protein [Paenibacillus sedimenti]|uniref:XdhC family protein n=1 Tax=Paenibacillus sedimenti TaxID=2770274 RepID=A0A926KWQ9_9BACL|nr:XdhC family protein [Paenibacillus sedimenti]MBD0383360.1 XdhC family protein [Paenibacillus sedimenti]
MESYDMLTAVENGVRQAVLATVIHVEGHAYRKQGAVMLFMEDGSSVGSISPGCLEADLTEYRSAVWESGKPQMVEYDMRPADDFGWGESIGCGGLLRILLEPVTGALLVSLLAIKARVDCGEEMELTRTFSDSYATIDYDWRAVSGRTPSDRRTDLSTYTSLFMPKPRVVVFGANQDAIPLVQLAISAGFRVVVADWRESMCTLERFPGAEIEVGFPEQLISLLKLTERDYVVVMSHQYQKDMDFVQGVMQSSLYYLGIMGSRERTERMLDGLDRPEWLHYPVGLRIGSEGPFENAVSIVAQLIAIRRGTLEREELCSVAKRRDIHGLGSW